MPKIQWPPWQLLLSTSCNWNHWSIYRWSKPTALFWDAWLRNLLICQVILGRNRFRECGSLGHLSFWDPMPHDRCDLFIHLSENHRTESMPLLLMCSLVPPQKSIFCSADFGSTTVSYLQQTLKPFLHSSQEQIAMRFFLEFTALSCGSEVFFNNFLWWQCLKDSICFLPFQVAVLPDFKKLYSQILQKN